MREQVIASRGSRDPSRPGREFVQRPTRRDIRRRGEKRSLSVRSVLSYTPSVLKIAAAILVIVMSIVGYRAAAAASLFRVRAIDITGTSRTSGEEMESLVRRAVSRTGVWRADVAAISAELERLPGVRRAVVARVLPDRLRIRIMERLPVAVVRTSAGHFIWVDEEGVSLGEMKSIDQMPPFFIRGWNDDGTEDVISSNVERVQKYLELARQWQTAGLAERVSEVNLIDIRDVRVQLAGDDSQIEVRLGGQDATQRLKSALEALDRYKQSTEGSVITYVDSQGPRVTLGFSSGNKLKTNSETPTQLNDRPQSTSAKRNRETKNDRKQEKRL